MKKHKFIFAIAFIAAVCPLAADVLYLNEGEEHTGRLLGIKQGNVEFEEISSGTLAFPVNRVTNILISTLRQGDEIQYTKDIVEPVAKEILQSVPDPASYPNSDFLTLYRKRSFKFNKDGSYVFERRELVKILKEAGLNKANQAAYYMSDRESVKLLWGHTYSADGRVYHLTDDTISDEGIFTSTPEYDRLRKLKFGLKKVDVGSTIDVAWIISASAPTLLRPLLIDEVYGEREPVFHDELVVEFPQDFPLKKRELNWSCTNPPQFAEKNDVSKRTCVWNWIFKDAKGHIPESSMPPAARIFPRVLVYVDAKWEDLASEFSKAVVKVAPQPSLLDSFITDAGIASAADDLDRAAFIYENILKKVRFLPIPCPATGGVEPVPIDSALTKRYGSPFTRVLLLHAALGKLGISSDVGFTQNWTNGDILEDIPNFGQAVYSVLRIKIDGQRFYTTCDNDYLPLGILSGSLQGANAFFLNSEGRNFEFEKLPENAAANRTDRNILVKLSEDGNMDVREVRCFHSYNQSSLRSLKAAKERERRNYVQGLVKRIHPKATLLGYNFSRLDDMRAPVTLTLHYNIADAVIKASDDVMAFKNYWIGYNSRSAGLATRTYPLDYGSTEEAVNTIVFELPKGFSWVPWKRMYFWNCGCMSYESTMNQQTQLLTFTDRFRVTRKTYDPVTEYPHYRSCLQNMAELSKQWLVIERISKVDILENIIDTSINGHRDR